MCSSISNLGFVAQLLDFNWLDFCSSNGIFVPFLFKNLQFDVTFPALPCSILSLDAMDISGEQHLDVVCILNCDFLFLHVREPFSAQWVLDFFFLIFDQQLCDSVTFLYMLQLGLEICLKDWLCSFFIGLLMCCAGDEISIALFFPFYCRSCWLPQRLKFYKSSLKNIFQYTEMFAPDIVFDTW